MSENLQNLLREALLNNSYDYDAMHTTLRETWENSYSYLYLLQKNYIEYEEMHYFSDDTISRDHTLLGDLYINKYQEACFDVDYDFIHVCNREEFYHSPFYFSDFTLDDILSNPKIFRKIPIIIIDNKTIWDYKIHLNKDTFTVTLPFKRGFVIDKNRNTKTDDIVYLSHKIQVMVVDNLFYKRVKTTRLNLNLNHVNYSLSLDLKTLETNVHEKCTGLYFMSLHFPNSLGRGYELGTMIRPCTLTGGGRLEITLSPDEFKILDLTVFPVYVSVIFMNKLHAHTLYGNKSYSLCRPGKECDLFVLQKGNMDPYAMPIPVEDLIVFKYSQRNSTYTLIKNSDSVELFYPNIYRIKDESREVGDRYYIYYFYHEADWLQYTPLHGFFYEYLSLHYNHDPIEKIINDIYHADAYFTEFTEEQKSELIQTFQKILRFKFYNHRYGDIDFYKRYSNELANYGKTEIEYKDETLKRWIKEDPFVLRDYVLEQDKLYYPVYHLWTNTLDLKSRLRTSTVPEMGTEFGFDLDYPCYVFSFRNENTTEGKLLDARVFVDGLYAIDNHQTRHYFTDYFYIDARLVTEDSYIEIEIFPSYSYRQPLRFTSLTDKKEITLFEPEDRIYPTAMDLFYITPSGHLMNPTKTDSTHASDSMGNDTVKIPTSKEAASIIVGGKEYTESHIYDNAFFELTAKYAKGEFVVNTTNKDKPVKFTRMSKFDVRPLTEDVLNKDIELCISKVPNGIEFMVEKSGYSYVALVENKFKFNAEYIRIFKNGRLVPRQKYVFISSYSFPRIYFLDYCNRGDIIYIDITPYRYKEIYYQKDLDPKQTLIDLKDVITKPFDIRYYDVYMNGRKLGINNVFTISPWQITFVNLKSLHNLQIFEKERDWEYFGTNYKTTHYFYTIEDLFNSSFITEEEKNQLIRDMIDRSKADELNIYPNTDNEEIIDFDDRRYFVYVQMFYFNELLPKTYVNPDRVQFDNTIMKEEYELIYNRYKIDPSKTTRNESERIRRETFADALALDPDIYIEGRSGKGTQYVYSVGHLDNVDSEILKEQVDLNNIPTIKEYNKNDLIGGD